MTEIQKSGKIRELCCLKFIFSQVEDPNFEIVLGNSILSGKWQPFIIPSSKFRKISVKIGVKVMCINFCVWERKL